MNRNLKLELRFDGSRYHGWQIQQNAETVQGTLVSAVKRITGKEETIIGCSRTDAGVHANHFCCNFQTNCNVPTENMVRAINTYLPEDIAVTSCCEMPMQFHAQYDCKKKEYQYRLYPSRIPNPFQARYSYQYRYPIDLALLNEEAKAFIGEQDFTSLCAAGSSVTDMVRHVMQFTVEEQDGIIVFTTAANGFLYNMVRIMVGTLLAVNEGKIQTGKIPGILRAKDRRLAGATVPPEGLFLKQAFYEKV